MEPWTPIVSRMSKKGLSKSSSSIESRKSTRICSTLFMYVWREMKTCDERKFVISFAIRTKTSEGEETNQG